MTEVKEYVSKMQESAEKAKVQVRMALKRCLDPKVIIIIRSSALVIVVRIHSIISSIIVLIVCVSMLSTL